jgi:hypothetical protein
MSENPPTGPSGTTRLTSRLTIHPQQGWDVSARVAPQVLGEEPTTAPLSLFAPAEPPIELEVRRGPQPQVLGAEPAQRGALLEYHPAEDAVYALLQEIHTPDGVIYDFTLPQRAQPPHGRGHGPQVLGEDAAAPLLFPVNGLVDGSAPAGGPAPATLGAEDALGGVVVEVVTRRVLQVIRSPLDAALLAAVRRFEQKPRALALRGGAWQPLEGADAWRALLPPGAERRVLLYVHGFGSNTRESGGSVFAAQLAPSYDAILAYDHPTVGRSPLENAQALLDMIPDDLRLAVDLVAHSRGGLVVRSLVELLEWQPKLRPARLLTAGTPHAGTRLAESERWDRLVSIGMTLGSWLGSVAGAPFWAPKLLEFVLKAAAQGIFDLPGIGAMTPGGDFLQQLNAPDAPGLDERVRYAAVTSAFAISDVLQQGFRQAFSSLAAQVFMGVPNDLVVPTASAVEIDKLSRALPPDQQLKVGVDHGSYFRDAVVAEFLRKQLA